MKKWVVYIAWVCGVGMVIAGVHADTNAHAYTESPIVINEVFTGPGAVDTWAELYNRGDEPVLLDGLRLYRSTSVNPTAFGGVIPDGTGYILPGEFYVIEKSNVQTLPYFTQNPLELWRGTKTNGELLDSVIWDNMTGELEGFSYGRLPDGGTTFDYFETPTQGISNVVTQIEEPEPPEEPENGEEQKPPEDEDEDDDSGENDQTPEDPEVPDDSPEPPEAPEEPELPPVVVTPTTPATEETEPETIEIEQQQSQATTTQVSTDSADMPFSVAASTQYAQVVPTENQQNTQAPTEQVPVQVQSIYAEEEAAVEEEDERQPTRWLGVAWYWWASLGTGLVAAGWVLYNRRQ